MRRPLPAWLTSPLAQFLVLGALIFAADRALRGPAHDEAFRVTKPFVDGLALAHRAQFGRAPSPSELDRLVRDAVREEVLVEAAVARGLGSGDPIVRRRLAQKMELALRGTLEVPRPTEAELRRYVAGEPSLQRGETRVSFRHAFVDTQTHTDARADALALLAAHPSAPQTPVGDAFPHGASMQAARLDDVARRFGAAFAEALSSCRVAVACGPIASPYGQHVVWLDAAPETSARSFESVRDVAESALLEQREAAALARAVDAMVEARGVVFDDDARPRSR